MPATCTIDRLHLSVVATAAPDRADALLARLRDVAGRRLAEAIAVGLEGADDDSLVFIERLSFDCALNAAWDDDRMAHVFARDFMRALTVHGDGGSVHRFADRAEFVASFVIALADGEADRRWWFDEFEGLRLLPLSSALRTVLGDEGATGRAALARLTDDAARRVLQALTPADGQRLLSALTGDGPAPSLAALREALASPLVEHFAGARHRLLAALTTLARNVPEAAGGAAVNALHALETLRASARAGALASILAAASSPRVALLRCCAAVGIGPETAAAWSDAEVDELLDELNKARQGTVNAAAPDAVRERSAWGGIWLLFALLARLGWWQRWHALEPCGAAQGLVLAVAARALLGDAHALITEDPLLRRALGHAPRPPTASLRQVLALPIVPLQSRTFATTMLGAGRRRRVALIEADRGSVVGLYRPPRAASAVAAALPAGAVLVSANVPSSGAPDDVAAAVAWWDAHDPVSAHGELDNVLAVVALNLLREFASRLPGCRESSPAYLRSQCLSMSASVALDSAGITVRLGRAPLDVLLTLVGVNRGTIVFPDGRALRIEAER